MTFLFATYILPIISMGVFYGILGKTLWVKSKEKNITRRQLIAVMSKRKVSEATMVAMEATKKLKNDFLSIV